MGRIEQALEGLRSAKQKALALFVTAGFPTLGSTVDVALALEQGGADIVEVGMPFSDPLADGPVIQQSSAVALKNGVTLARILEDVRAIRRHSTIPLVLMGYLNPILRYGFANFMRNASDAGIDGIILPEVPLEEVPRFRVDLNGLSQILLVTPESPPERVEAIDRVCGGFLYCVSTTGVTGSDVRSDVGEYLAGVRAHVKKNRMLVGFGISRPEDAGMYVRHADGVIVGSALIRAISEGTSGDALAVWVRQFKNAIQQR